MEGVLVGAAVGFTAKDIVSLVNDWKSSHPTKAAVDQFIAQIKTELTTIKSFRMSLINNMSFE
jgi:hypothetical protein